MLIDGLKALGLACLGIVGGVFAATMIVVLSCGVLALAQPDPIVASQPCQPGEELVELCVTIHNGYEAPAEYCTAVCQRMADRISEKIVYLIMDATGPNGMERR